MAPDKRRGGVGQAVKSLQFKSMQIRDFAIQIKLNSYPYLFTLPKSWGYSLFYFYRAVIFGFLSGNRDILLYPFLVNYLIDEIRSSTDQVKPFSFLALLTFLSSPGFQISQ